MREPNHSTLRDRTFARFRQSLAGEKSDGYAVFNYYTFPFFHNVTGVPLKEYFHNPKLMTDIQVETLDQIGKCGSLAPDAGPVAECSALGGHVRFDAHGFISVAPAEIEDLDDILKIQPGDPYGDNYMRVALETLEYMVQNAPQDYKVNMPPVMAPFTVAAQLRGVSDFCTETLVEPEMVEALLDIATETVIRYIAAGQKILGAPLHHVFLSDDLSAFLSPSGFKEWVLPTYEKIFKAFPGVQFWLHNDAKAAHLAEDLSKTGFLSWQYGPALDPMETMEKSGGRLSLMGGLNPVEMQNYSAQQTYDVCVAMMERFGGNNRFILGAGGSINQIPVENINAMLRAADEFKIPKV